MIDDATSRLWARLVEHDSTEENLRTLEGWLGQHGCPVAFSVRKWLRRYQQHGPSGLVEGSRAPHHQPHQTPPEIERHVVELRQALPTFGARRLIREFDLPLRKWPSQRMGTIVGFGG